MKPGNELAFSAADIGRIERLAWQKTFRRAAARSPFYREHFRKAGIGLRTPVPFERLAEIPPIDKDAISARASDFLCAPENRISDIVTTSGSTGQPLVWKLTDRDLERLAVNESYSFSCAGLARGDTVILAVALDRCFIAGMAYFLGLRKLGCAIERVGPASPLMHLDMIRRTRPTAIVGVPSFLCLLAQKAVEAGCDPAGLGIRKAICIGEPIREADLSLNRTGALLERQWGARTFSTYGNTELANSLCECEAGCGGHVHPEFLYIEALDEEGRPVPDGVPGELTATTFGVEAMPLIRYRTGDYAAIYREPCRCGRASARLGPIVGRKQHKLKIKGTTIFPSTLRRVLEESPGVRSSVIIARRAQDLSDTVEVRAACAGDGAAVLAALRERFQAEAKVTPQLTVAAPEEIEALQMPEGARKRRYFVDLRV